MLNAALISIVVSIPALLLIGFTVFDAARRHDLRPLVRATWIAVVVVLPVLGTFLYLLARPLKDPGHVTLRTNAPTAALVELLAQREAGQLSDREFARAKREFFGASLPS